ncbi:gamma-glutamylcyclotransferase family protein [Pseudomonas parafulva]|uniref:gamma-glutamylcyclotransferase family protein n=1 Tax=Pseudomonas TaxID=286 RepID=UPI000F7AA330|nr:gamma-glutamylcyclotransferase family protein [Pseudomonas putida]RSC25823.1 gamma-glutamylcyclotransferase [Pseudomonas putida]HEK0906767.1 gamma-glutamylcyclotransferase [Pseudomonas putida]HEK1766139.1 gamma-glutamylcyclotransferase [Pseudomonas putida]HEK1771175.1 gamma-glutamylcyclotransferase [Pseudomonas putida]
MTQHQGFDILLFSYGTLQDKAVQLANFGRELVGLPDQMTGYTTAYVEITDPEVIAASGKTHHPIVSPSANAEDSVPGMVFKITAQELAAADAYEVSDYKRVAVGLVSGLTAWVYVKA